MKEPQASFSEPFLNFLNTGLNKPIKTYCENNNSKFHDSNYIWCRICDKIFCTQCSMNHLLNNQINHKVEQKIFLTKEHFDIEFKTDFDMANKLRDKIIDFFNNKNSDLSYDKINSLKEVLNKFQMLANELFNNIIPKFIKKYNESISNLLKSLKEVKTFSLNKDNVKIRCQEIITKYKRIEQDYTNNEKFEPKMMKPYYDELASSLRDVLNLDELIENNINNNNNNNANNPDINKEYNNINSNLAQAINIINSFKKDLICHINN
jgi:hypothetical protein